VTAPASVAQDEAFCRIRLLRSPHVGPISYLQLLHRFGTAQSALEALPDLAARGGQGYRPAPCAAVEAEIDAVRAAGARYLFHDAPGYPELLGRVEGAPPILTVRGDLDLAAKPGVAIVGARNASAAAVKLARDFAHALAERGFAVVSGLARGIDGATHEAALPATIGVIASGIDVAYPPQHADLQERIAREGLLIAEQPPGTEPRGSHFPSRNRIIAGLALGTLVVEAAPKSGSLITARLAGVAGREVFALPGSIHNEMARGCHELIRQGAKLVECVEDVLCDLRISLVDQLARPAASAPPDVPVLDKAYKILLDALAFEPASVDSLIERTGLNSESIASMLLILELDGHVAPHPGGRYSRMAGQVSTATS